VKPRTSRRAVDCFDVRTVRVNWVDPLLVVGLWALVAFGIGAEPWVSLDTPDSEFHASMAIYASAVTDRADVPVYYWTRLGHIAPAHLLTSLLGPVSGLEAYRLVLLAIIVGCLFAILRRFTSRLPATVLTGMIAANTVLLGYLGNPYPTATSVAAMLVMAACLIRGRGWPSALGAGIAGGWLVMTSPYGTLLALVMALAILATRDGWPIRWGATARTIGVALAGAVASFTLLWASGRLLFPQLDWLQTYLFWNSALNQADYIYDLWRWQHDPSLLVPAMAVVIAGGAWVIDRWPRTQASPSALADGDLPAQARRMAAALAVATPVFALAYWWRLPNNYLEIPHYQAMLFPAALLAIGLVAAARMGTVPITWPRGIAAAVAFALVVAFGHLAWAAPDWATRLIALAVALVALVVRRGWLPVLAATTLVLASAQVLQNARDSFGVSTERLYANAFRDNEAALMMRSATLAQDWVIEQTAPGDRVLTWVDATWTPGEQVLLPLAAFQLWGANEAEHGKLVTAETIERWNARKPLAIVMYGKSMGAVLDFWNGIPKERKPTTPACLEVPWPVPSVAQVCVTRLDWGG